MIFLRYSFCFISFFVFSHQVFSSENIKTPLLENNDAPSSGGGGGMPTDDGDDSPLEHSDSLQNPFQKPAPEKKALRSREDNKNFLKPIQNGGSKQDSGRRGFEVQDENQEASELIKRNMELHRRKKQAKALTKTLIDFCRENKEENKAFMTLENCENTARAIIDMLDECYYQRDIESCSGRVEAYFRFHEESSYYMVLWGGKTAKRNAFLTYLESRKEGSLIGQVLETTKIGFLLDYVTNHSQDVRWLTTEIYWEALSRSFSTRGRNKVLTLISVPRVSGYFWKTELVNIVQKARRDTDIVLEWATESCEEDLRGHPRLKARDLARLIERNCSKSCEDFVVSDFGCQGEKISYAKEGAYFPKTRIYCKTTPNSQFSESSLADRLKTGSLEPILICSRNMTEHYR